MADLVRQRIFRTSSSVSGFDFANQKHKSLCFATVRHMNSKESELDADQGRCLR
ncbi:hypothetical protein AHF37_05593 [Paragonimus kellicotti]|nr:hypothetical protein AHF37_05593 [Paragonimus kellicotti]